MGRRAKNKSVYGASIQYIIRPHESYASGKARHILLPEVAIIFWVFGFMFAK
jgi:hypothetical protein